MLQRLLLLGILFLFCLTPFFRVSAQALRDEFGQNRIQYQVKDWKYYSTDNFDIYYYEGGQQFAKLGIEYLEEEFDRMTDLIGYSPYSKVKIFLYNSEEELGQSNVGLSGNYYSIGGQTNFTKSHVELAYPGTMSLYRETLLFHVAKLLVEDMMFGGSLADMFQSTYLLNLPTWFVTGASAYIAEGWSVEMDDFVRELIISEDFRRVNSYSGEEAQLLGQSIWNFIVQRYGRANLSNILNLTRIIHNEERSIVSTLGISYPEFISEWQRFYKDMSANIGNSYQMPQDQFLLFDKNKKGRAYGKMRISPDGTRIAYAVDNSGKFSVEVEEIASGKVKTIIKAGYKEVNHRPGEYLPLISWKDDNTLGIIYRKKEQSYLQMYEFSSKSFLERPLGRVNNITSFDIKRDSNVGIIAADRKGRNGLFLVSLKRFTTRLLTKDIFDDIEPRFIPNTNTVVFASNRISDTLGVKDNKLKDLPETYNIFLYNLDTTRTVLTRVTNNIGYNIKPVPVDEQYFYYLSNQQGIYNLYRYDLENRLYQQVSNYAVSIRDYDIGPDNAMVYTARKSDKDFIYYEPNAPLNRSIFTLATGRRQLLNAKAVKDRMEKRKKQALQDSLERVENELRKFNETLRSPGSLFLDSIANTIGKDFDQPPLKDLDPEGLATESLISDDPNLVNTDNYQFSSTKTPANKKRESFLTRYRLMRRDSQVMGPDDYETYFRMNNLVTSFVIDPLMGFGIQMEAEMTDLLEDHRFYGGFVMATDFRSGTFFGEYEYLKGFLDYRIRYDRRVLNMTTQQFEEQQYKMNKLEASVSLPVSISSRVSLTPMLTHTVWVDKNIDNLVNPPINPVGNPEGLYSGIKGQYVFDNTTSQGLNLRTGFRANAGIEYQFATMGDLESFGKLSMDIRHYLPIHKEIVVATRLYYGRFFGDGAKQFLLGGVNNWLFNQTENDGQSAEPGDPLYFENDFNNSDILFAEYVTDLRGFNYNTFSGTNALLGNIELRVPLIRYLSREPISSNFLRNLQFVGFFDIGSAWTGPSAFARENNINTDVIEGGPFVARINNFKNPWLYSYGVGMRAPLLGFFTRLDLAWATEDYERKRPRLSISIGYDF
ncbi:MULTISPECIES: hypothetical protein [Persicobacter]|uniref:Translocation protein TolB n=1 Tax=Persicobacter diffluens TaxID=981 RepID=A0AAN5AMR5_9BACT|nr:hypothetical protein [Persicobacter sp. CCB-QB2]GJM62128.1 hypothetical protein PEDI_26800 [Persicobacter diffluens]